MCPYSGECSLKDKVPENKFTSSKDILILVYLMVKNAQLKEKTATDAIASSELKKAPEKNQEAAATSNLKNLLEEEANRQMQGFKEQLGGVQQEEQTDKDKELVLYLSGLKIVDNLKLVAPKDDRERAQVLEMLEQHISEFTVKKKTDIALETRAQIRRSISKKKHKRDEKRSIHDLVLESNHKMKQFEVDANSVQQKKAEPAAATDDRESR